MKPPCSKPGKASSRHSSKALFLIHASGSDDTCLVEEFTSSPSLPPAFYNSRGSTLRPHRIGFLTCNSCFLSLASHLLFIELFSNNKFETMQSFTVFEIQSCKFWGRSCIYDACILGIELFNLVLLPSVADSHLFKDNTDSFSSASRTAFRFFDFFIFDPNFVLSSLAPHIVPWVSSLLILFNPAATEVPDAFHHLQASYTRSFHRGTVIYTIHVYTFRNVAAVWHRFYVALLPYILFLFPLKFCLSKI